MNDKIDVTKEGQTCPHCGQFVKLYKRPINSAMAIALIRIDQHFYINKDTPNPSADEWAHVPKLLKKCVADRSNFAGGDAAKLTLWGLIEALQGERDDGSTRVGFYKITSRGHEFVWGQIKIPKYVFLYNRTVYGFSDGEKYESELIDIRGALSTQFNYGKLMGFEENE